MVGGFGGGFGGFEGIGRSSDAMRRRRARRRRLLPARRDCTARMVEHQALLSALEQTPILWYDLNFGAWTAVGLRCDLHTSVEEAAARSRRLLVADVDVASIRCVDANSCVESHNQGDRAASVAKTEHVCRARRRLNSFRDYQPVVRPVPMHGERDGARLDVGV